MRAETIAVRILGRRSQSLLTPNVSGLPPQGQMWEEQGVALLE